jgi:hypothetical protein
VVVTAIFGLPSLVRHKKQARQCKKTLLVELSAPKKNGKIVLVLASENGLDTSPIITAMNKGIEALALRTS